MPAGFKGCAIELGSSKNAELGADNPVFKNQKEVFHAQDVQGTHAYYLVNLGPRDAATTFFLKKVKPVHPLAKLVLFGENGKEYLK